MKPTAPLSIVLDRLAESRIVRASDATAILDRLAGKPVQAAGTSEGAKKGWETRVGLSGGKKVYYQLRPSKSNPKEHEVHIMHNPEDEDSATTNAGYIRRHGNEWSTHHPSGQYTGDGIRDHNSRDAAANAVIDKHNKSIADGNPKPANTSDNALKLNSGHLAAVRDAAKRNGHSLSEADVAKHAMIILRQEGSGGVNENQDFWDAAKQYFLASDAARGQGTIRAGAPDDDEATARAAIDPRVVHCRDEGLEIVTAAGARWELDQPTSFQWMPGGVTTLTPTYDGHPIKLTVQCDASTAECVQASFDNWRKKYPNLRPFGCVEHREEEAAIFPDNFEWKNEPEPGVFCTALPTELGARNVNGRIHRSWSPSFRTDAEYHKCRCADCQQPAQACDCGGPQAFPDGARGSASNPARITGVAFSVGSLTNKPAFKNILPVRAKQAGTVTAAGTSEGAKKGWEDRRAGAMRASDDANLATHKTHKWDTEAMHRKASEAHNAAARIHKDAEHAGGPWGENHNFSAFHHGNMAETHEMAADRIKARNKAASVHSDSADEREQAAENQHPNQSSDAILARLADQQPATIRAVDVLDRLSQKT